MVPQVSKGNDRRLGFIFFFADTSDHDLDENSALTFTSASSACLTFELSDDDILEGEESFGVSISEFGGAAAGSTTSATVTIDDTDGQYIVCIDNP